jgi:hypothetical protein
MRHVWPGVVAALLLSAIPAAPGTPIDGARARQVFEKLKSLEGRWRGKSTKGWTEETTIRVIAGGSVVEMASFDAHPGEQMRTMFHLDGDRLLLTHYCVARNQPRLVARAEDESGIVFEFLDATGLPSRDKGHMDKARYRFVDDRHFVEHWTWYQDGQERWMEEITMERLP